MEPFCISRETDGYAIMFKKGTVVSEMTNVETAECDAHCGGSHSDQVQAVKERMLGENKVTAMAEVYKAMGDPTRIRLLYALIQAGELCVHDLCTVLDMTQSAVSHQLRYLRNVRIVKRRKVGKTVFYSIDDHHIEQLFEQTLAHMIHD